MESERDAMSGGLTPTCGSYVDKDGAAGPVEAADGRLIIATVCWGGSPAPGLDSWRRLWTARATPTGSGTPTPSHDAPQSIVDTACGRPHHQRSLRRRQTPP